MQDYNLRSEATSGIITNDVRLMHLMLMLRYNLYVYLEYLSTPNPNVDPDYILASINLHKSHLKPEIIRYISGKNDPLWDNTIEQELCEVLQEFDVDCALDDLTSFCVSYSEYIDKVRERLTQKDRRNLDILQARFMTPTPKGR